MARNFLQLELAQSHADKSLYKQKIGDGEGTQVTVAACLMKGDNDDSLTWPFTGIVTIELLNQLENKNYHSCERVDSFVATLLAVPSTPNLRK